MTMGTVITVLTVMAITIPIVMHRSDNDDAIVVRNMNMVMTSSTMVKMIMIVMLIMKMVITTTITMNDEDDHNYVDGYNNDDFDGDVNAYCHGKLITMMCCDNGDRHSNCWPKNENWTRRAFTTERLISSVSNCTSIYCD